jgi:hypothetical protein
MTACLVAGLQTELDFAFQVLADVGAQTVNRAVGNAERLGKRLVHFGQVRLQFYSVTRKSAVLPATSLPW